MKFTTLIDNITAQKWGLSIQEAYLFDWLFSLPSWANKAVIENEVFYFASKNKAVDELPMLTDKPDTMYRYYKSLQEKELILISKIGGKDYVALTDKAKQWNGSKSEHSENNPNKLGSKSEHSENNPNKLGSKSEHSENNPNKLGNKSENNSENNPTYKNIRKDKIIKDNSSFKKPEEKKVEGFNLAQQERLQNPITPHELTKLTIEETKEKLLQDDSIFEIFARGTRLERKNYEKAVGIFIKHTSKKTKYPRAYNRGTDHSEKHFLNWYVLRDFKEFLIKQSPPEKKPASKMNPEEFKAFSEEQKLQEKRDFEQNARDREQLAQKAKEKQEREANYLLNKKTPTVYPWMQLS